MDNQGLREHLTQLRAELGASGPVDQETRVLLGEILRDIIRLTETPGAERRALSGAAPAERLEAIAVQFEADHPAFAASVRRLVDLLGKLGV
jgi:Domain of unknown function (DUF4404)